MELLIFSDSHGSTEGMRCALARQIRVPDAVCFLGDGVADAERLEHTVPLWCSVRGNCDWGMLGDGYPNDRTVSLAGHTLLLTHGHCYHVKETLSELLFTASQSGADLILFGHTHTPTLEIIPTGSEIGGVEIFRPIYLFNPGSIGQSGSFGTLSLRGENVLFSHGRV